MARKRS